MNNQLSVIQADILSPAMRDKFEAVLVDQRLKFDAETGFALQILQGNNYLAGIAQQDMGSLRNAVTNVASIGISLNPAKKQAYLVPRKGKVCLDISYIGMLDLAVDTGAVQWGQASVVRQQDTFELNGIDKAPTHSFSPFATDRGDVIGAYVVVKTAAGDYLTHAMPISAINAIRDRSEAWKAYKAKGTLCPWVTDYEEMVKKTVVKQASKYWPKNGRLENAIHHMSTDGGEGIEKDMGPAEVVVNVTDILAEIAKTNDFDTLQKKRKEWNTQCIVAKDLQAWGAIKGPLAIRLGELKPENV